MKILLQTIILLYCSIQVLALQKYEVNIDLINIKNDKVFVEVKTPTCAENTIVWCMPAIVPGTYAKYDFGRFIDNFKAISKTGKKLKVKRKNANEFVIFNATQLATISYKVNDTWDANLNANYIFQPAGTNIERGKNVVLNHHGFVGYLATMQNLPFEITIKKPTIFFANTALKTKHINDNIDVEFANNYFQLADSPTLYSVADTVSFKCKNSTIHIGLYSSQGIVKSCNLINCIKPLANALTLFFNVLPVNDYYFTFYFSGRNDTKVWGNGASGALEHNYSSFYFLPELDDTIALYALVKDVSAHEFLHILTPLNVHSSEIENFDFIEPKMSEHLWLYEGVTEYFSQLVQLRGGLISENEFVEIFEGKIKVAKEYPPFSFTQMSKNVCVAPFKDYYDNVYQKGALLGFLLDIELTNLSSNKFGLPDLMNSLTQKYGPYNPFVDSLLFKEIAALTHPKIANFFNDFIIGSKPLPYETYFDKIGWNYKDSLTDSVYNFGKFGISAIENSKKSLMQVVRTDEDRNYFGLKSNDNILSIDGKKVNNYNWNLLEQIINPKNKNLVEIEVIRNRKKIILSAVPRKKNKTQYNKISLEQSFTKQQKEFRTKLFGDFKTIQ